MKNRVCCLYRVSTDQQVDYDKSHTADIPMQRIVCHRFAEEHGWEIVKEVQEEGVSGHKIRAANRDGIQKIKEAAINGEFDILLVFMFDRLGRIADETPFVVEWFVRNGIRVWSTQEGEQKFESHADKLMNYIRFWQADGESEKTSIRTRTRMGQIVEEGHFKGGVAPYGYHLVKGERISKRKHALYELEIIEEEAAVVRLIFEKYAHEGYGAQRLATWLTEKGYVTRTGKPWHHATVNGIVRNLTYTGVLRSGESRSQTLPHLQIITPELYEMAQEVRTGRMAHNEEMFIPRNTKGKSLLIGNIYCAHCGSRLSVTTNVKKDAKGKEVIRLRYICYGKSRKQTQCNGQTGYLLHRIDDAVNATVSRILSNMAGVSKSEVVNQRFQKRIEEKKALLSALQGENSKADSEVKALQAEVIRAIQGESNFPQKLLSDMLKMAEEKQADVRIRLSEAEKDLAQTGQLMHQLEREYNDVVSMAEMYAGATMEAKKMIVARMLHRVTVGRDYNINMEFRGEFKRFFETATADAQKYVG